MIIPFNQKNIFNLDNSEKFCFGSIIPYEEEDFFSRYFDLKCEEPLLEKFKLKSLSDEIMESDKNSNNIIQDNVKSEDLDDIKPPDYFSLSEIKNLIIDKFPPNIIKEFNENIFLDKNLSEVESWINNPVFLGKKKKKKATLDSEQYLPKNKKEETFAKKHNKYCGDNIIKKFKKKLFEGFLKLVNNVINNSLSKTKLINYNKIIRSLNKNNDKFEDLLKITKHKKIEGLQKKRNLSQLYMSFNQLFTNCNISPKYTVLNPYSNKVFIENILKDEYKNENISLVLNMKFKDWIDIFTYKKDFNSILKLDKANSINFSNFIEYADKLILEIYKKNTNDNYILYFLVYLYNYERWFFVKRGRNRASKISENETI